MSARPAGSVGEAAMPQGTGRHHLHAEARHLRRAPIRITAPSRHADEPASARSLELRECCPAPRLALTQVAAASWGICCRPMQPHPIALLLPLSSCAGPSPTSPSGAVAVAAIELAAGPDAALGTDLTAPAADLMTPGPKSRAELSINSLYPGGLPPHTGHFPTLCVPAMAKIS